MNDLLQKFFGKDRVALSRLISVVENRSNQLPTIMDQINTKLTHCPVLGITGPPGAGKSTLVNRLISEIRKQNKKVGVLAIDPSSPFTGGAVLGDRIRMLEHTGDEGVFIRSLGSRGAHGGLSHATRDIVKLFDAFGMDWIIVETVGVGQTELDIMEIASTTLVVLTPESGDTIQTMKAGLLEVADIFAVNKADREGASKIELELKAMVHMGHDTNSKWEIPVLKVQAAFNQGIQDLFDKIQEHETYVRQSGLWQQRIESLRVLELKDVLQELWLKNVEQKFKDHGDYKNILEQVKTGKLSPYSAAQELLNK